MVFLMLLLDLNYNNYWGIYLFIIMGKSWKSGHSNDNYDL